MARNKTIRNEVASRQVHTPNGGASVTYNGSPIGYYEDFTRSDIYKSPLWPRRRSTPGIYVPPTTYLHSKRSFNDWKGFLIGFSPGSTTIYSGQIGSIGEGGLKLRTLLDTAKHEDLAIIKALLKLKKQNINLSVAFAERAKTSELMLSTAQRLGKSVLQLKKGNVRGALSALGQSSSGVPNIKPPRGKKLTNAWLELQYGWKPLLSDVHGAAKAIADRDQDAGRYRVTVKGNSKDSSVARNTRNNNGFNTVEFSTRSVRANCRLDYTVGDSSALSQASSLGLLNPFSVAWEIVPFSFMIDWFLPIGDFLNVMDAALPYSFLGGYMTTVTECGVIGNSRSTGATGYYGNVYAKSYDYDYKRYALALSPLPSLPRIKPTTATPSNVASALSIIAGAFKGG